MGSHQDGRYAADGIQCGLQEGANCLLQAHDLQAPSLRQGAQHKGSKRLQGRTPPPELDSQGSLISLRGRYKGFRAEGQTLMQLSAMPASSPLHCLVDICTSVPRQPCLSAGHSRAGIKNSKTQHS